MAAEFSGSLGIEGMLPAFASNPVEGDTDTDLFRVVIEKADETRFICGEKEARFVFCETGPRDNKEVYFEVLFFLQSLFAHLLLKDHGLHFIKAATLIWKGRAHLVLGDPGAGKSTLVDACLAREPTLSFHDGKVLVDEHLRLRGGNAGLAPRRFDAARGRPEAVKGHPLATRGISQHYEGLPLSTLFLPTIELYAPAERFGAQSATGPQAVGRLFRAVNYFADGAHNHLDFFQSPIPQFDDEVLYRRRYAFARKLATLPVWRCYGDPAQMAEFVLKQLTDTQR
jgi:ABC-type cobalamin/Fe3+-siderophores transport system ATPase subunit